MKKNNILLVLAALFLSVHNLAMSAEIPSHVSWTVVGAGPTGILTVGIILDHGVSPDKILWIDPEFGVGRMGKLYQDVPGNGTVRQYIALLEKCKAFSEVKSPAIDLLYSLHPDQAPQLKLIVDPFLDITNHLRTKVVALQDEMTGLDCRNDIWTIKTNAATIQSDYVVLATGAHPRVMQYEGITQIPLDLALNKEALAKQVEPSDRVLVIGSGHSALLIVKHLTELSVAHITNLYKKPIVYQVPMRRGIAWQEAGLKGRVATWAKTVLEVNPPANLVRLYNTPDVLQLCLAECTKVICAVGFERNELPTINGDDSLYLNYDRSSGIIAPRCFGVGIAFPQQKTDPLGNVEYLVGLPYLHFDALIEALNEDM